MTTLYKNFLWWRTGEPQEMLVENGRVVWRGRGQAEADRTEDLGGKTLFPSYIDSHCHILPTGLDLQKLHLGKCQTHAEVLDAVRERLPQVPEGKWLLAVHYDQTKYEGARHLTRDDLDRISTTVPILLRHVNGHACVVSSAALKAAKVAEDVQDPPGGSFGRDATGRITGVLFEQAHEAVSHASPSPNLQEMVDAILAAANKMSALGIACASDMMTGIYDLPTELEAYRLAGERGCPIQTRLYLQWSAVFRKDGSWRSEEAKRLAQTYKNEYSRVAGIKIFADGAIGSATAAIYGAYSGAKPTGHAISRHGKNAADHAPDDELISGQLIYAPSRLNEMVRTAHDAGFQVAIHSIGDYATDLVMDAYEALDDPSRHRIEHAMIMSDTQIERLARLNCFCTMQPEFLMRFGHYYRSQLGPDRAAHLKRARSVIDAGIRLSFSSDRPIVAGDPADGIATAVYRPEGFDQSENVTFQEAVDAYTIQGAKVTGDDEGGLEPGQRADFRLGNPSQ